MTDATRFLVGCYTDGSTDANLVAFALDPATGGIRRIAGNAEVSTPSWVALAPDKPLVYAVSEVDDFQGQRTGALATFELREDGSLHLLDQQATRGPIPCHVGISPDGRWAATACYRGASATLFALAPDGRPGPTAQVLPFTGSGPNPRRQEEPHPHSAVFSPDGRFVFVQDLGTDCIHRFRLNPEERCLEPLGALNVALGAGPRHLVFHPNGRFVYVTTELLNTLDVFAYGAVDGTLEPLASMPMLPANWSGESYAADLHVTPDGRFLYASNRGHDSLVVYAVDATTGRLTTVGHHPTGGNFPRGFHIAPTGHWLVVANQNADNLRVFHLDPATGRLTDTGHKQQIARPVCVRFLP